MKTLYDLLGALPHDNAEGLRTAFRRAVKGAHPDLRPGDPDAALRFREIVRASEILGDAEQREAYDHLLELAWLEQESQRAPGSRIHRLASGVIALTGALVVVGGYFLFMYMSSASVASANNVDVDTRAAPNIAIVSGAEAPDTTGSSASPARPERKGIPVEAIVPRAAMLRTADAASGPAPDLAASEAMSSQGRGISVYSERDLRASIADFDWAFGFHPQNLPGYLEPAVIFYRLEKFDGVFPGIAPATASRSKSAPTIGKKPRLVRTAVAPWVTSLFPWRTAAQSRAALARMR
jgi:hypothetical protein